MRFSIETSSWKPVGDLDSTSQKWISLPLDDAAVKFTVVDGLGRDRVAVMQTTESRQRDNVVARRRDIVPSTIRSVLLESEMSSVLVVQVDDATPIVLNREKSFTLGILGTTAW